MDKGVSIGKKIKEILHCLVPWKYHTRNNRFPLVPYRETLTFEYLSPFNKRLFKSHHHKDYEKKLLATFHKRRKYMVMMDNIKITWSEGLNLVKIKRAEFRFRQVYRYVTNYNFPSSTRFLFPPSQKKTQKEYSDDETSLKKGLPGSVRFTTSNNPRTVLCGVPLWKSFSCKELTKNSYQLKRGPKPRQDQKGGILLSADL